MDAHRPTCRQNTIYCAPVRVLVGRKGPEAYTFLRGAASGGAGLASASGTASAIGGGRKGGVPGAGKGAAGYVGFRSATCCNTSAREAPERCTHGTGRLPGEGAGR